MFPANHQWWHQSVATDAGARPMRPLQFPDRRLPVQVDLRPYMTPVEDQEDMSTWYINTHIMYSYQNYVNSSKL